MLQTTVVLIAITHILHVSKQLLKAPWHRLMYEKISGKSDANIIKS